MIVKIAVYQSQKHITKREYMKKAAPSCKRRAPQQSTLWENDNSYPKKINRKENNIISINDNATLFKSNIATIGIQGKEIFFFF